ncbi:MAG: hypothetical protein LIO76_07435 [Clostridiales bacterium]|nr:hypothetical protein [Clostridiales bacterium]
MEKGKEAEKKMQENMADAAAEKTEKKGTAGKEEQMQRSTVSETWAEETIADLDDYIESQGIYLRQ